MFKPTQKLATLGFATLLATLGSLASAAPCVEVTLTGTPADL